MLIEPHIEDIFNVVMFTDGIVWRIDGTVKINKLLYGYFPNETTKKMEKKPLKAVFLIACGSSGLQFSLVHTTHFYRFYSPHINLICINNTC